MVEEPLLPTPPDDFDNAWKEALEIFFPEFLAFFLPEAAAVVNWENGYTFLNTELRQMFPESEIKRRHVDALVQLTLKTGDALQVLTHVEVQSQSEDGFEERIAEYQFRLRARYKRNVAVLVVLGDDRPNWRPDTYTTELWGTKITLTYPVVKLLDYRERIDELRRSRNPFAVIVRAHLATLETRHNGQQRKQSKFQIVRELYERGYTKQQVNQLFLFIDWLLKLPAELEQPFWDELHTYEEEIKMPYITSVERLAIQKGLQQGREEGREQGLQQGRVQGLRDGIQLALDLKFGAAGVALMPDIARLHDPEILAAVLVAIKPATTPEQVRVVYQPHLPPPAE
ncbi:MAG: cytosolic protein [Chloroflexaceae bacterium]|nr:cytosolic protein [Chloroflexaceae bacterium]